MNRKFSFAGQVVLVTGASSGIGRELAVQLATQSAQVVLVGRDVERLAATQAACAAAGTMPHAVVGDVSDEQACRRAVAEAVAHHGRLDALFCMAGQAMKGRFRDADNAQARVRLMGANFDSVVYLCHQALPHLARSGGRVVVTAGLLGHVAVPGYAAYAAAKHAVVGFCRSLRRELASEGVAVTLVSPDTVRTSVRESMRDASGRPAPEAYGPEKTMLAVECARRILEAAARRQPELVLGRGPLLQALQSLAPRLLDGMLGKAIPARASGAA
jgi:NAD(P)-dependent dehydrogenase (short-subunit alcohol dehydrogenase family)